ncbi:hypothetical protein DPMN_188113 [Dreissena polymorpha]|uniref:Uncharacterized protein n=1 Tax=Dreissena polymorpha TaxID=45954 RepID=A0A9D4I865_DREPO|nr:hypothetical protein DPMN_188113 [Dreissena polymorpha]
MTKTASVSEVLAVGSEIMTITSTPTTLNAAVTYAFATSGNPGDVGVFDGTTANKINLNIGKKFDYETSKTIVFIIT